MVMFYHPLSKGNLRNYNLGQTLSYPKKIGTILREADLVSQNKIDLALQVKQHYSHLLLGEILAMQGFLKPETADFFVEEWSNLLQQKYREPLGYYLQKAALLQPEDIGNILEEQRQTGVRFGTVAVLQGLIKSTTLDFFLINLFPHKSADSPFINLRSSRRSKSKYSRFRETTSSTAHDSIDDSWQDVEIDNTEILPPSKFFIRG